MTHYIKRAIFLRIQVSMTRESGGACNYVVGSEGVSVNGTIFGIAIDVILWWVLFVICTNFYFLSSTDGYR